MFSNGQLLFQLKEGSHKGKKLMVEHFLWSRVDIIQETFVVCIAPSIWIDFRNLVLGNLTVAILT